MEVNSQLHAPTVFPHWTLPLVPFDRRLGGLQSRSGCRGEHKNHLPPLEIEPRFLGHPAHSLFTLPTGLSQLAFTFLKFLKFVIKNATEITPEFHAVESEK
jgi:hypothetical protein